MPPTRTNYNQNSSRSNLDLDNLDLPYFQGSIEKREPSSMQTEVVIVTLPKKEIIEIIDVDADTSGQVVTEKNNIEKIMNKLKSKSNKNI